MLIDNAGIARGDSLRAQLDRMTAEFLSQGGQIQQCGAQTNDSAIPFRLHPATEPQARRQPRQPKKYSGQEDLARFARKMLEAGI